MIRFFFAPQGRVTRRLFWLGYVVPAGILVLLLTILLQPEPLALNYAADAVKLYALPDKYVAIECVALFLLLLGFVMVGIKRCHDFNRSGWLMLLGLIPWIGNLVLFCLLGFIPGTAGPNHYGPDPRQKMHFP